MIHCRHHGRTAICALCESEGIAGELALYKEHYEASEDMRRTGLVHSTEEQWARLEAAREALETMLSDTAGGE